MADEGSEKSGLVMGPKIEAIGNGMSAGSSGHSYQQYKRRKCTKKSSAESKLQMLEDGNVSVDSSSQHIDKTTIDPQAMGYNHNSCNQIVVALSDCPALMNDTFCRPLKQCRDNVHENMYQSLPESGSGLQECIRDALEFHVKKCVTTAVQESLNSSKEILKSSSETELMPNGIESAYKELRFILLNGNGSNQRTNTELCKRAYYDIIKSENFIKLCTLLSEDFPGTSDNSISGVASINTRIKDGAYECSPMLFQSDIQQLWTKLQKFGTEITALANSLSEKSRISCHEQFPKQESDMHAKPDQSAVSGIYTCKHCGRKAQGRGGSNYLICDSCEDLYHLSCIKPRLKEIPSKNWYCLTCTNNGVLLPHDDCLICEQLNAPVSSITEEVPINEESVFELEGNSNGLEQDRSHCIVCQNDVEPGVEYKTCAHPYCPHKYYHTKCLTNKQLSSYGNRWLCPSCLCRGCLTDIDDDKILLCEACDHAYHIYCMSPEQFTIPKEDWFCRKCQEDIDCMREVKNMYLANVVQEGEKNKDIGGLEIVEKENGLVVLGKCVGVNMVLRAPKVAVVHNGRGKEVANKSLEELRRN